MSGRRGHVRGRGGRGGYGFRGRGKGSGQYTPTLNKNKGLCIAFGNKVLDYFQKGEAEQMWMTWENIFHHAGTIYGHGISNKPQNKKKGIHPQA